MAFGHILDFESPVFQTSQQQNARGEALAAQHQLYLVGITAVCALISPAAPGEGGVMLWSLAWMCCQMLLTQGSQDTFLALPRANKEQTPI